MQTEFINIRVPKTVLAVEQRSIEDEYLYDWFLSLASEGFKVSFAFSTKYSGHSVYVTDKRKDSVNGGRCISAWGSSLHKCIMSMFICIHLGQVHGIEDWARLPAWLDAREDEILNKLDIT